MLFLKKQETPMERGDLPTIDLTGFENLSGVQKKQAPKNLRSLTVVLIV